MRKLSFFSPGMNWPSLVVTSTSTFTRSTVFEIEKVPISDGFFGGLAGRSGGGSSFFFGME
jgi:hypothetical protein